MEEGAYTFVLPVTDDTMQPLAEARDQFPGSCILAIPPDEALAVMTDKARTFELAESLGIALPRGITCSQEADLLSAATELGYPLVLKPGRSLASAAGDLRTSLFVAYASDEAELMRHGRAMLRYGAVIIQERVTGDGVGIEVLADQGEIVQIFEHRRIHEWPLTGGGSSYRESVSPHPALVEDAKKLMRAVNWHGVAMVEFKHDLEAGRHWLMEVNGRFWGSLPLALAAGADFPRSLHDLLVLGRRPTDPPARTGIRSRQFTRDFWWTLEVLRRVDPNPLIDWPSRGQAIRDLLRFFLPSDRLDLQSFRDPRPGFVEMGRIVSDLGAKISSRVRRKRLVARAMKERRQTEASAQRLRDARALLFLCHGNINRSALAEHDLRRRLGPVERPSIVSAGFHLKGDRPADPTMRRLADEVGVSLEASRSRVLDEGLVRDADLIFVMEAAQQLRLEEEHPGAIGKTMLLGSFAPLDDSVEIADPYGGEEDRYRRARDAVMACTERMATILRTESASC
ncbi:MAG: ATP-grasp domain-containing protein [Planctomycetes bacterium]|nr:ATP-grasp domain-containing protein [Planctomycetota bacterium]